MKQTKLLLAACLALAACTEEQSTAKAADYADDPPLETDAQTLERALVCTPFAHPDRPPVLLVHGSFTNGHEQYDWSYLPLLDERGFDVCTVTYPDRGMGDMQISAEYVVHALRRIHAQTGRKVAVIGHSQGVTVPRWAIKWWRSAREAVDDFVMQAGPNHGADMSRNESPLSPLTGLPESFYQFGPESKFMIASNIHDETPGSVSYTSLYTLYDEIVQPVTPVPTAAVDYGKNNPKVANILLQDVCPGRFVDHVTIGLTDRLSFELALDAITNHGPANIERAGGAALCGLAPIVPDQVVASEAVQGMLHSLQQSPNDGFADPHLAHEEPPLKPYVR